MCQTGGLGITTSPLDSSLCAPRPAAALAQPMPEAQGFPSACFEMGVTKRVALDKSRCKPGSWTHRPLTGDSRSSRDLGFLPVWGQCCPMQRARASSRLFSAGPGVDSVLTVQGFAPGQCPVEPIFPLSLSGPGLPGVRAGSQMPSQSFCGASFPRAAIVWPLLPSLQIPGDACLAGKHSK